MPLKLLPALLLTLTSLFAQNPAGFVVWPKGVAPSKEGVKFDNHALNISHREKSGVAELHEKQTDIFVIQSGEATLVVGGEVIDPKSSGPDEVRGPGIRGGVKTHLSAGDVVHIPAKMPHQFFLDPGTQITYFAVKIDERF
jgi:mannose-6-phosphate isomerase-like protein (cupin superfamily)